MKRSFDGRPHRGRGGRGRGGGGGSSRGRAHGEPVNVDTLINAKMWENPWQQIETRLGLPHESILTSNLPHRVSVAVVSDARTVVAASATATGEDTHDDNVACFEDSSGPDDAQAVATLPFSKLSPLPRIARAPMILPPVRGTLDEAAPMAKVDVPPPTDQASNA